MVTTVRYIVPTNDQIIVDEQTTMHWPSNTNWDRKVHDWIDAGNTIDPYDPHYGIDTEQIRANKYLLNADLADGQIEVAQSNPVQGVQLDERETRKAATRRDNRAHQQNGITDQDDALVTVHHVGGGLPSACVGLVDHVVVQQRSGVNVFHRRGEFVFPPGIVAAEMGREDEERGAYALAPG